MRLFKFCEGARSVRSGSAALALVIALVGSADSLQGEYKASAQDSTTEFSMEIAEAGCGSGPNVPAECAVPVSSEFVVTVSLDRIQLEDMDGDTIGGYFAFQVHATNSGNVTAVPLLAQRELIWPDCGFPVESRDVDSVTIGCATDVGAPASEYTGAIRRATICLWV